MVRSARAAKIRDTATTWQIERIYCIFISSILVASDDAYLTPTVILDVLDI